MTVDTEPGGMTSTTAEHRVNGCAEQLKAEIISLYQQGLGPKRICKWIGWAISRNSIIRDALREWGVYVPGRDKGGGSNKGEIKNYQALIMEEYKREQKTLNKLDSIWGELATLEISRIKAVRHYWENREAKLAYAKERDARLALDPKWRARRAQICKEWKRANPDKVRSLQKKWMSANPDRMRVYRKRQQNNPQCRAANNLRKRVRVLVKGKTERYSSLLGCSPSFLAAHLEAQFKKGMTWQNYGAAWHIDHIEPCAKFDLTKSEHRKRCFHYTNLQPLLAEENLKKSDKILAPIQPSLPLGLC